MVNFGIIKDTFNNILSESIIKKNDKGKKIFKQYIKLLREDQILKTQYFIYKNLESKKFSKETDAKFYIKENIDLLKKLDKKKINKSNTKVLSLLKDKEMNQNNSKLYDHINILITTKKTPTTLDKLQESINYIKDRMVKDSIEVVTEEYEIVNLPPSVLTKMAVNRFNSKYSDITGDEKEILKSILNGSEENKKNVYENIKLECIDLIDNKLQENTDLDMKDKMLKVKDKLLRMSYNPNDYVGDINKVHQLKQSVAAE
tara:strand:- start:2129 stop:2905 length:777 start_codon:yes stop_codon:yes gene_type:complete